LFDIAWSELMVIGAVALVVIGPKDLPKVMREVGKLVSQGRTMARSFRAGFDEMMRESELDEIRKQTQTQMLEIDNSIYQPQVEPAPAEAAIDPAEPAIKS
jgi:sec-independent protein translocase protein TatB